MSDGCRVISVHGPHPLSGVTMWAARMAATEGPLAHRMLVVRRATDPAVGTGFPGFGTPGFRVVNIEQNATLADEVTAIAEVFHTTAPGVALVHDHVPAAIAAGVLDRPDLALASIAHADEPRYADLFDRIGPLLDVWWGDSDAARRRAETPMCAPVCAGAFPGGAPRISSDDLPPREFSDAEPARLLWLGRVERYQKRALDAADVIARLADRGVPARLTIAGDGPALPELRERVSAHGLGLICHVIGAVPPADIPSLIARHHALVMTSAFEGTPVAAAEAAHHGRALFVTEGCGGLLDLMRPGDLAVTAVGDTEEQASAIEESIRSPGMLRRMGRAARTLAHDRLDQAKIRQSMDDALREGFVRCTRRHASVRDRSGRWDAVRRVADMVDGVREEDVRRLREIFIGRGLPAGARDLPISAGDEARFPLDLPRLPRLNERLIADAIGRLRARGCSTIVLYGAGHHTASAGRLISQTREIIAIVDDRAPRNGVGGWSIGGVPVVSPDDPIVADADAIIVSSSEYEDVLAARSAAWAGPRPVVRLYRTEHRPSEGVPA